MTKIRDGVLPRSGIRVRMPPGSPGPRPDSHEQAGPCGGRTDAQMESARGTPLQPTFAPRQGLIFVRPTQDEGGE